jgi:hypothetical protein
MPATDYEHLITLFLEHIQPHLDALAAINAVARLEGVRIRLWPMVSTGWRRQLEELLRPSQARRQQIETQIWFVYWPEPSRSSPAEGAEEANASPTIFWATSSLEAAVRVMRQRGLQHCTPWTPLGEMEMTRAAIAAAYLYEYIDPGEGRVKEFTRRVVIRTAAPEIPRRLVVQGARRQRDPARPGDPDLLLSERDTVVDLHAPDASAQVDAALERIVRNGWDLYEVTW